jgi:cyclohexa-1,5-dienecarbonyl-CoA hydratase
MGYTYVETHREEGVGRLVLNNPPLNVLTIAVMEEMVEALRELENDAGVKLIVLEAAGDKAFSAGVDVADHTPEKMDRMLQIFNELCLGLHRSSKPTIAAVRGMALGGGCELAAVCDMVVASESATFGQPEVKVGVYPVLGVALFTQLMNLKMANELLLTGRTFSAEESRAAGLVNRVAPEGGFDQVLADFVKPLRYNSGVVMSLTKKAILAGLGKDADEALEVAEKIYVDELMHTEDANEGLQAFIEKRRPVWKEA